MNAFENELSLTFRVNEYHWHKRKIASTATIRFLKAEGFDYTALFKGQYYGIEAKMCSRLVTSFPFNRLEDHQIDALLDCEKQQGIGYIFINFRKPKNICYAIRIKDFVELRDSSIKKSISCKEIAEDSRFTKFIKHKVNNKLIWNLDNIIRGRDNG